MDGNVPQRSGSLDKSMNGKGELLFEMTKACAYHVFTFGKSDLSSIGLT